MCVIVDNSVRDIVFAVPHRVEYAPLWRWIEEKDGKIVYGGKLTDELYGSPKVARLLAELKRGGRALQFTRNVVDDEEKAVRKLRLCRSDDQHVIALARISGARILCANDKDLEQDFTNPKLVPKIGKQQGKIYKKADHERVLGHNRLCKQFLGQK